MVQFSSSNSAMESRNYSKNGADLKNQTSQGNKKNCKKML